MTKIIFKKKTAGYYMTIAAAILSLADLVVYSLLPLRVQAPYITMAAALVVFVALSVIGNKQNCEWAVREIALINAVLMAATLVIGIAPMVNQVGFVIAGLDTIDTIMTALIFSGIALLSMIVNVIASYIL